MLHLSGTIVALAHLLQVFSPDPAAVFGFAWGGCVATVAKAVAPGFVSVLAGACLDFGANPCFPCCGSGSSSACLSRVGGGGRVGGACCCLLGGGVSMRDLRFLDVAVVGC